MMNTQLTAVKEQKKDVSAHAEEIIGYEKGAKMIKNYYDQNDEQITEHFVSKETIEAILAQPGAVGMTILSGLNEAGLPQPVLVGVNGQGHYILGVTSVGPNGEMNKQKGIVAGGGVISP
ncbi:MAG TPA: hypothetical protein VF540_04945, partial [Segetibacter sp.]